MKNKILLLFLVAFSQIAYGQKPNTKTISLGYIQLPMVPLATNIKTYYAFINNKVPSLNISNTSELTLEGYKKVATKEGADLLVQLNIQAASYESAVKKTTYKEKVNDSTFIDKTGGAYTVTAYLTTGYIIKDFKNNKVIVSKSNLHHTNVFESDPFDTYNMAVQYVNEHKGSHAKDLYNDIYNEARKEFSTFANDIYGYPLKYVHAPIARGKGKKHDYSDLAFAFDNLQITAKQSKGKELTDIQIQALNKSIETWQKALKEYQPNTKKARIGDKIIGHIYFNIAAANFMLKEYDTALKNLEKAAETKSANYKAVKFTAIIKDLQDRQSKQNL